MSAVPRRLLRDVVFVQTKTGHGAGGSTLASAVMASCKVSMTHRLVRTAGGKEALSEMTIQAHPDDAALFTEGSLVTYEGRTSTVISCVTQSRPGEAVLVVVNCT